jgi:hypothetical protein
MTPVGRPEGRLKVVRTFKEPHGVGMDGMSGVEYREVETGRVWVCMSGGIAGEEFWFGPVDEGKGATGVLGYRGAAEERRGGNGWIWVMGFLAMAVVMAGYAIVRR